jgi:hypothetical protein
MGTIRFSPILNPLTSELNLLPSSYYPGAAWKSVPEFAKVPGLLGDDPKLMFGVLAFVIASAISWLYSPGPTVL